MDAINIQLFKGSAVLPYLDAVIQFRTTIFREYPYLYESDHTIEDQYIRNYAKSKDSLFVIAQDHNKVVGCVTSIPVMDVLAESWAAVLRTIVVDSMLYLGDILVLKEYRNRKIGAKMYEIFESSIRKEKQFSAITFQEIVRSKDDPKRPKHYRSLDSFWQKRGYIKHPELIHHIPYREVGESRDTLHTMVFWVKTL